MIGWLLIIYFFFSSYIPHCIGYYSVENWNYIFIIIDYFTACKPVNICTMAFSKMKIWYLCNKPRRFNHKFMLQLLQCFMCTRLVPTGFNWLILLPTGFNWSILDSTGTYRFQLVCTGPCRDMFTSLEFVYHDYVQIHYDKQRTLA